MNTEKMPLENENEPSCLGAVMRWVAVAESIPAEHKLYLTYDGTFQVFRYWKGNHFEGEHVANEPKVTYWMEVPEPPFA
jgi:hypothetical protein